MLEVERGACRSFSLSHPSNVLCGLFVFTYLHLRMSLLCVLQICMLCASVRHVCMLFVHSLCSASACFCVFVCVMHRFGCVFVKCVCMGVCLCVSGCEPSISLSLSPSGLCVGLFHQHYHLLVFYSGPRATMTAETSRFAHQAHQIGSLTSNLAPISYRRTNLSWIPRCS